MTSPLPSALLFSLPERRSGERLPDDAPTEETLVDDAVLDDAVPEDESLEDEVPEDDSPEDESPVEALATPSTPVSSAPPVAIAAVPPATLPATPPAPALPVIRTAVSTAIPDALPFRPRRFSGNEAQARSLIAQRAIDRPVALAGADWRITLEPLALPCPVGDDALCLAAQWAGARFRLTLPASTAQTWVAARFPDLDLSALPPALRTATFEEVADAFIAALNALQRGPAQLEAEAAESAVLVHSFALSLRGAEHCIYAALATDTLGLMLLAGLFSSMTAQPNGLGESACPLVLRAEIGRSTLAVAELAGLALGDFILIDHAWVGQSGELWLGDDRQGLRVRCDDTRLIVTQPFSEIGLPMTANVPEPLNPDLASVPAKVDSIPVTVVFDLGERAMTLSEIRLLQPGQVLDLGRPLASAVSIRANGTLIGLGELVEIDGRLGVSVAMLAEAQP